MLTPTNPHRYSCPCGQFALEVAGPAWRVALELAAKRAAVHGAACPSADGAWEVVDLPPGAGTVRFSEPQR